MSLTIEQKFALRDNFLDLTSDSKVRTEAYPIDEWLSNGGDLNNYNQVSLQDSPPTLGLHYGGLLSGAIPSKNFIVDTQDRLERADNIANYWQKVESHEYYKWLNSDSNFVKAWKKFQKRKETQLSTSNETSILIKNEFARFRFVRLVTLHIGFQMLCDDVGYKPKYINSRELKQAKGYVSKLQSAFKDGLKMYDLEHQLQLERLLEQLFLEINPVPRKEKETSTSEKRKCLESFAFNFLVLFEFITPTILTDLAAMLGWTAEHTTFDRIVELVKKQKILRLLDLKSNSSQKSKK